jgi:hypothetical protein
VRRRGARWQHPDRPGRLATRAVVVVGGIDLELARRVAAGELKDSSEKAGGENVFTMVRKIGQAKAGLAARHHHRLKVTSTAF